MHAISSISFWPCDQTAWFSRRTPDGGYPYRCYNEVSPASAARLEAAVNLASQYNWKFTVRTSPDRQWTVWSSIEYQDKKLNGH